MSIEIQIVKVMSQVFEVSENDINLNSSADNIESWDSLRHMNLVLALEEEFGVIIPDEEVGNLMSFKLILLVLADLISGDK
jgi:acyl carrier protein